MAFKDAWQLFIGNIIPHAPFTVSCSLSQRKAGQSTLILLKGPQDTGKATGQHVLVVGCM